jgi:hypothetical protein
VQRTNSIKVQTKQVLHIFIFFSRPSRTAVFFLWSPWTSVFFLWTSWSTLLNINHNLIVWQSHYKSNQESRKAKETTGSRQSS